MFCLSNCFIYQNIKLNHTEKIVFKLVDLLDISILIKCSSKVHMVHIDSIKTTAAPD
jgi:hypothetical protein